MKFSLTLFLDRFIRSKVITHEIDGKEVKGIFIPFAANNIRDMKCGCVIYLSGNEIKKSVNDNTHYINFNSSKSMLEIMEKTGLTRLPILGYMKPVNWKARNYGLAGEGRFDEVLGKK